AFGSSAEVNPDDAFGAMGRSYDSSRLRRRGEMLMLLQGFAASDDEEVREAIGHRFAELWRFF
ncbi:MAG TPA: hypothetical protein VE225_08605, partial [Rubrobacteraceae bacterium]|nr:hypothetical protein [Rubrobacteraceae bacterium]